MQKPERKYRAAQGRVFHTYKYKAIGAETDLDQAVEFAQEAADLVLRGSNDRPRVYVTSR
jgi:hypothetical protein